MSELSSLALLFVLHAHLGAEIGAKTSARALYQPLTLARLAFSEKRSKRLKRRSVVDSDVFHVNRNIVFVWKRVCRAIHRRVLFDQSLSHLEQRRLFFFSF